MDSTSIFAFWLQGAGLALAAFGSWGPFQTFLVSETLIGGFRRGAPIAFAPLISDVPIVLLMLFVLKQLPPIAIGLLSLAGGVFVLYLAWSLMWQWRANTSIEIDTLDNTISTWASLRKGVIMNFLGPGPYLFWALVNGPILISALNRSVWHGLAFLLGFYGFFISLLVILAAIFHQARRFDQRIVRGLLLVSIIILIIFGGLLIRSGLAG
jgi:threonine/homoserine/homoserine lactone efflux protein